MSTWDREGAAARAVTTPRTLLCVLSRASRALVSATNDSLARQDLTATQWMVLNEVVRSRYIEGSQVAAMLNMSPSSVADVLRRLESKGLVVRGPTVLDARVNLASATKAGAELAERCAGKVKLAADAALRDLGFARSAEFFATLRDVADNLRQLQESRAFAAPWGV